MKDSDTLCEAFNSSLQVAAFLATPHFLPVHPFSPSQGPSPSRKEPGGPLNLCVVELESFMCGGLNRRYQPILSTSHYDSPAVSRTGPSFTALLSRKFCLANFLA